MTKNHDENREIFLISRHVVYVAFSKKYPAALLSSFIKEWMQADYGRLVREGYDRFWKLQWQGEGEQANLIENKEKVSDW